MKVCNHILLVVKKRNVLNLKFHTKSPSSHTPISPIKNHDDRGVGPIQGPSWKEMGILEPTLLWRLATNQSEEPATSEPRRKTHSHQEDTNQNLITQSPIKELTRFILYIAKIISHQRLEEPEIIHHIHLSKRVM